jgi:hypothetical protein
LQSPHKFKGGLSGCVRECGEGSLSLHVLSFRAPKPGLLTDLPPPLTAQSKDFGLIATDKVRPSGFS